MNQVVTRLAKANGVLEESGSEEHCYGGINDGDRSGQVGAASCGKHLGVTLYGMFFQLCS